MAKNGRYASQRKKVQTLTETYTVTVADCGTEFLLNSATEFATTLPNAADAGQGWWCRFTVKAAPASADYTVLVTDGDGNNLHGCVFGAEAGACDSTTGTGTDVITFVDGKAKQGDYCAIWTDGTDWYAEAMATEADGITYS